MSGLSYLLSLIGLKPNMVKIMTLLLLSNRALSLRELSELTGYGKSRVSEIMKVLEARGLVEVSIDKKRTYYRARIDALIRHVEEHVRSLARSLEEAHRESGIRDFLEIASKLHSSYRGKGE